MRLKQFQKLTMTILGLTLFSQQLVAHNQSPATIRKSMLKVYEAFGNAPLPKNIINGKTVQTSAGKAQTFDVVKEGKKLGVTYQIEINEEIYTVGVDTTEKKVVAVVKAGSSIPEPEWKDLTFINVLKENAVAKQ